MPKTSLKAHFDGQHIVLDEPCELSAGEPLRVTVLSENPDAALSDRNRPADAGVSHACSPRERNDRIAEATPRRSLAIVIGCAYVLFITQVFTEVTNWSYGVALGVTATGCVIVMGALSALGLKAYGNQDSRIRFTFSTVFLASIPLSVYLAAIRLVLLHAPGGRMPVFAWVTISLSGILAMIVSTAVLMSFAEALIWFAVACLPRRRNGLPRQRPT